MDMDMDMDSQQWGTQQQHESDHQQLQHQAKVPKLRLITDEQETHVSALPLFAAAPLSTRTTAHSSLTPFPLDSTTQTRFSWGGGIVGLFSLAQWQELELQALIYKYMLAGAPVPSELILPIKKSLLAAQPYYYQHHQLHYQHLSTAMLQGGYWGKCAMDPEPGRCRRTDGKKWRCSREVVPGHKYCERHVHRGRNRSRKHVELATTTPTPSLKPTPSTPPTSCKDTNHFTLNHRGIDGDHKESTKSFCSNYSDQKVDSHVLRKFFSERPRSQAQHDSNMITTAGTQTLLSISINPGNPPSSDVSLKLSTGGSLGSSKDYGDTGGVLHPKEPPSNAANHANNANTGNAINANHAGNWSAGWGNGNHGEEGATGGPLAEALRSSTTSTASPTSVLQKTSGISASETSSISI